MPIGFVDEHDELRMIGCEQRDYQVATEVTIRIDNQDLWFWDVLVDLVKCRTRVFGAQNWLAPLGGSGR